MTVDELKLELQALSSAGWGDVYVVIDKGGMNVRPVESSENWKKGWYVPTARGFVGTEDDDEVDCIRI
jgi:hypothetical protein